ncbi:MAG: DNA-directed RNA polymerase subunit omega [Planctomycetaceae bacterium]
MPEMLDDFREDDIVRRVGGRFKLSTLVQKRMVALNRGARPLVDLQTKDLMQVVVAEIMQNKIYLDTSGNVQAIEDNSATIDKLDALLADDGGPSLDDL